MTNHYQQTPVAAGRSITERRERRRIAARGRLVPLITAVARKVMFAAPRLRADDRQFLSDAARGEGRYPMTGVDRMLDCAAQAETAVAREALPEALRGEILRRAGVRLDVLTAFEAEEQSNGPANLAQWRFVRERSQAACDDAIEKLMEQQAQTRASIDALLVARGAL